MPAIVTDLLLPTAYVLGFLGAIYIVLGSIYRSGGHANMAGLICCFAWPLWMPFYLGWKAWKAVR